MYTYGARMSGWSILSWGVAGYYFPTMSYFYPWTFLFWQTMLTMMKSHTIYVFQGIFCPSLGAKFRPHSQSEIATFFPNTMSIFCFFFFLLFFRDHYYLWETMAHIRMILKHLCLSGVVGIIQSIITWFWGYILLPLLCPMSLISPNFAVKSIIFSQLWPGAFPKIAGKSPVFIVCQSITSMSQVYNSLRSQLEWNI